MPHHFTHAATAFLHQFHGSNGIDLEHGISKLCNVLPFIAERDSSTLDKSIDAPKRVHSFADKCSTRFHVAQVKFTKDGPLESRSRSVRPINGLDHLFACFHNTIRNHNCGSKVCSSFCHFLSKTSSASRHDNHFTLQSNLLSRSRISRENNHCGLRNLTGTSGLPFFAQIKIMYEQVVFGHPHVVIGN